MEQVKFNELAVSEKILKALDELGFEYATPIQGQSIPHILEGRDVIGLAQTGTGKTLAFGLPIIQTIDRDLDKVQVLVLSPTRELALQITSELRKFSAYEEGIRILTVYGGESIEKQITALKKRPQIVVGTPGRIMDHMRRKTLRLDHIRMVVLDEADEMLNMGFQEDIDTILQDVPETKQMVLFSATFPQELMQIAKTYQKDPVTINVRNQEVTVKTIKQCVIETSEASKFEVVARLIDANAFKLSLIFCNTKKRVDEVAEYLHIRGYRVKALHGDMKQKERDFVMNLFRKGQLDVLIATDVAARGIDVDDIDAVINFDIPQDEAYYVHRIGRTGRAGREGISYILATSRQKHKLRMIERLTKTPLVPSKVPTLQEIEAKRMETLMTEIARQETSEYGAELARRYLPELASSSQLSYEDLAETLLALLIQERFPNIKEGKGEDVMANPVQAGFQRIYLNLGSNHRMNPGAIIRILASESGVAGKNFGAIEINSFYSYVEVPERFAKQILALDQQVQAAGKTLEVSPDMKEDWANQPFKTRKPRQEGKSRSEGKMRSEGKPRRTRKDEPTDFSGLFSGNKNAKRDGGRGKADVVESFFRQPAKTEASSSRRGKGRSRVMDREDDRYSRRKVRYDSL